MSMQVYQAQPQQGSIADITMPIAKFIHLLGEYMIDDDKDDLFKTSYMGDTGHIYHGEVHPDHPGFFHHWMWGGFCIITGQALGTVSMVKQMMQAQSSAPVNIDDIPLPGGRLMPKVIPIPYREVPTRQPALPDTGHTFQRMMRLIDKV